MAELERAKFATLRMKKNIMVCSQKYDTSRQKRTYQGIVYWKLNSIQS